MAEVKLSGAKPYIPSTLDNPPVRAETMLFSIVEPNPGFEVAYNDWYERDHQFDGGTCGEGWFSNRRWVATRRLKQLRFPEDGAFPHLSVGSLCQVYWRQAGFAEASEKWAVDQWFVLNEANRIFNERQHFHSASYRHLSTVVNPGERVPLELALQHPFKGMVAFMVEDNCADGSGNRPAAIAELEQIALEGLLGDDIPIQATWELPRASNEPLKRSPASVSRGAVDSLIQLAFLRDDPEALWPRVEAYADAVAERSASRITFAGGFIPTIPGTTTYLDEL